MKNHLKIVKENFDCEKGSFIYFLYEEAIFDDPSFWKYYYAVHGLIEPNKLSKNIERETARMVFNTYSNILRLFIFHLSPRDGCTIKKFPIDKLHACITWLESVVNGYFAGNLIEKSKSDSAPGNPGAD